MDFIDSYLTETVASLSAFQADPHHRQVMTGMADAIVGALRQDRKLLICGNGGSAGDSQHIAGEFISRLMYDRAPLAAIALTTDTSVITATGNDYGYEHIFTRQVQGLGQKGDVLLGISTSGRSPNVLSAFGAAREKGMVCIGFTGSHGGPMQEACSLLLEAPSPKTAIIQQIHIVAAHIICALVESTMFPRT
ncbi:MAG TPA: D-sedoheptulose 7-phosphate isomerase [Aliidongia sp.]|uniref:D-sedoheptulose 7-phosphate isomerase n=1 Tax=Aliidongia sp. TaxID=1914230 RepID=UPI002DDD6778|nr:D-sedoheptulose 7-phosphate isomerase [Aliidongia sp.]HEV2673686.1 D-sedoheptulose 7-phosphate isomerase [Aliidongia sp.]